MAAEGELVFVDSSPVAVAPAVWQYDAVTGLRLEQARLRRATTENIQMAVGIVVVDDLSTPVRRSNTIDLFIEESNSTLKIRPRSAGVPYYISHYPASQPPVEHGGLSKHARVDHQPIVGGYLVVSLQNSPNIPGSRYINQVSFRRLSRFRSIFIAAPTSFRFPSVCLPLRMDVRIHASACNFLGDIAGACREHAPPGGCSIRDELNLLVTNTQVTPLRDGEIGVNVAFGNFVTFRRVYLVGVTNQCIGKIKCRDEFMMLVADTDLAMPTQQFGALYGLSGQVYPSPLAHLCDLYAGTSAKASLRIVSLQAAAQRQPPTEAWSRDGSALALRGAIESLRSSRRSRSRPIRVAVAESQHPEAGGAAESHTPAELSLESLYPNAMAESREDELGVEARPTDNESRRRRAGEIMRLHESLNAEERATQVARNRLRFESWYERRRVPRAEDAQRLRGIDFNLPLLSEREFSERLRETSDEELERAIRESLDQHDSPPPPPAVESSPALIGKGKRKRACYSAPHKLNPLPSDPNNDASLVATGADTACGVCLANKASHMAFPCMHASFCVVCVHRLVEAFEEASAGQTARKCPFCKQDVRYYTVTSEVVLKPIFS